MFADTPEITNVIEFDGGIVIVVGKLRLLVTPMLKYELVAFLKHQNLPPFDVAVLDGSCIPLKAYDVK